MRALTLVLARALVLMMVLELELDLTLVLGLNTTGRLSSPICLVALPLERTYFTDTVHTCSDQ